MAIAQLVQGKGIDPAKFAEQIEIDSPAGDVLKANLGATAVTPSSFKTKFGLESIGGLKKVLVYLRGNNDNEVCDLVGQWSAHEIPVEVKLNIHIKTPAVHMNADNMIFGLTLAQAYRKIRDDFWQATDALVMAVRAFFSDDPFVTVRF